MREWRELHRQLLLTCEELGWEFGDAGGEPLHAEKKADAALSSKYALLHRALIAGLPTQIGHRGEKGVYDAPRQRKFQLFPGSPLAKAAAAWVLSATCSTPQKVWGLMAAKIEPEWVIAELPHLLARKHFDPHWSRAQGRVIGSEQISLFGLVLAPKKPVHYGGLYPAESREIFVRQALADRRDQHARGLRRAQPRDPGARRSEEEAKLRRAGLVADEDWQARWYLDRLPPEINSVQALDAGTASCRRRRSRRWNGRSPTCCRARAARPIASRSISRSAMRGWRCTTASSRARRTTA